MTEAQRQNNCNDCNQTQKNKKQRRESDYKDLFFQCAGDDAIAIEEMRENYQSCEISFVGVYLLQSFPIIQTGRMFSGTDCNGTPAEYIEKLREDLLKEIPGTSEYDSICIHDRIEAKDFCCVFSFGRKS